MNYTSKLYGTQSGLIKKLKQFTSAHYLPDQFNDTTDSFVKKVGQAEVDSVASEILDKLRDSYALKRIDYSLNPDLGITRVETPQVNFSVSIGLDPLLLKQYILSVEITRIKDPLLFEDGYFGGIFDLYCNQLKVETPQPISVSEKIDAIEAIDELRSILEYPSDASTCSLKFESINLIIEMMPQALNFQSLIPKGLEDFSRNAQEAMQLLLKAELGEDFNFNLFPVDLWNGK